MDRRTLSELLHDKEEVKRILGDHKSQENQKVANRVNHVKSKARDGITLHALQPTDFELDLLYLNFDANKELYKNCTLHPPSALLPSWLVQVPGRGHLSLAGYDNAHKLPFRVRDYVIQFVGKSVAVSRGEEFDFHAAFLVYHLLHHATDVKPLLEYIGE